MKLEVNNELAVEVQRVFESSEAACHFLLRVPYKNIRSDLKSFMIGSLEMAVQDGMEQSWLPKHEKMSSSPSQILGIESRVFLKSFLFEFGFKTAFIIVFVHFLKLSFNLQIDPEWCKDSPRGSCNNLFFHRFSKVVISICWIPVHLFHVFLWTCPSPLLGQQTSPQAA